MSKKQDINSIINSRLSYLKTNKSLAQNVTKQKTSKRVKKAPYKVAVIICLCFLVAVPVMASRIPTLNRLLNIVSAPIAQLLKPIELVVIENGIKMQVIAAYSDDQTTIVYYTLTELTDQNRIDKSIDVYDYFLSGFRIFRNDLVDYNEKTKTATFRLTANEKGWGSNKVTFVVESFLSKREFFENIDTKLDLKKVVNKEVKTIELDSDSCPGGGMNIVKELRDNGSLTILKPNQHNQVIPDIDFVEISNIGFINGRLHVQTKWSKSIDNHGSLYLIDKSGNKIKSSGLYFDINNNEETIYGRNYREYVFDIGKDKISKYSLYADLIKNNSYTEGKWQTTFKIEPLKQKKVVENVSLKDLNIKELSISRIGANITVQKTKDIELNPNSSKDIDLRIIMKEYTNVSFSNISVRFSNITSYVDNNTVKIKYLFRNPIDLDDIKEIYINDTLINLN